MKDILKDVKVRNAILIGGLCSVSYLAVYIARNMLSAVTPQMLEIGVPTEFIGELSSLYFILYAIGQLINGVIGDKIKSRYMISLGLILAGICNAVFPLVIDNRLIALFVYGMTGFALSMIYAPITKVVAENTEPIYAVRCSMGYTFSSLLGSPFAGILAALLMWRSAFTVSSSIMILMGLICFTMFWILEKKGIVRYNQYDRKKEKNAGVMEGIKILIQNRIVKFSIISILTGVVRTTVVFWLPTYLAQYLGFSSEISATIFTAATLVISLATFVTVFLYEKLGRRMDLTIFVTFTASAIAFLLVFLVKTTLLNIVFLVIAIMAANCAASIMFSIYLPGLRDTGMVSSATGYIDFLSYMAASISSTIFANAVSSMGWGNLILVWCGLMVVGILISVPTKQFLYKRKEKQVWKNC